MKRTFEKARRFIRSIGMSRILVFIYAFALARFEEVLVKKPSITIPSACVEFTKTYTASIDNYKMHQASYYLIGVGVLIFLFAISIVVKIAYNAYRACESENA